MFSVFKVSIGVWVSFWVKVAVFETSNGVTTVIIYDWSFYPDGTLSFNDWEVTLTTFKSSYLELELILILQRLAGQD